MSPSLEIPDHERASTLHRTSRQVTQKPAPGPDTSSTRRQPRPTRTTLVA